MSTPVDPETAAVVREAAGRALDGIEQRVHDVVADALLAELDQQ